MFNFIRNFKASRLAAKIARNELEARTIRFDMWTKKKGGKLLYTKITAVRSIEGLHYSVTCQKITTNNVLSEHNINMTADMFNKVYQDFL